MKNVKAMLTNMMSMHPGGDIKSYGVAEVVLLLEEKAYSFDSLNGVHPTECVSTYRMGINAVAARTMAESFAAMADTLEEVDRNYEKLSEPQEELP